VLERMDITIFTIEGLGRTEGDYKLDEGVLVPRFLMSGGAVVLGRAALIPFGPRSVAYGP
jgi:hypothetical protein